MLTADVAVGQTPLVTVHKNVFVPVPRDVMLVEGLLAEAIIPAPDMRLHAPLPAGGLTAFRVADDAQSSWSLPALAVGTVCLTIVTVDVAAGQLPLDTVHRNVLLPLPSELTADE